MTVFFRTLFLASLLTGPLAQAEPIKGVDSEENPVGIYLSLFGDTTVPYFALNVAYDPDPNLRFTAGAGISFGYTVGVGARYRFFRDWAVRPYLGWNLSALITNFPSTLASAIVSGFSSTSQTVPYYEAFFFTGPAAGFEWKASSGFYLALGGNAWMMATNGFQAVLVPNLNIGCFF